MNSVADENMFDAGKKTFDSWPEGKRSSPFAEPLRDHGTIKPPDRPDFPCNYRGTCHTLRVSESNAPIFHLPGSRFFGRFES